MRYGYKPHLPGLGSTRFGLECLINSKIYYKWLGLTPFSSKTQIALIVADKNRKKDRNLCATTLIRLICIFKCWWDWLHWVLAAINRRTTVIWIRAYLVERSRRPGGQVSIHRDSPRKWDRRETERATTRVAPTVRYSVCSRTRVSGRAMNCATTNWTA